MVAPFSRFYGGSLCLVSIEPGRTLARAPLSIRTEALDAPNCDALGSGTGSRSPPVGVRGGNSLLNRRISHHHDKLHRDFRLLGRDWFSPGLSHVLGHPGDSVWIWLVPQVRGTQTGGTASGTPLLTVAEPTCASESQRSQDADPTAFPLQHAECHHGSGAPTKGTRCRGNAKPSERPLTVCAG